MFLLNSILEGSIAFAIFFTIQNVPIKLKNELEKLGIV